MDFFSTIGHAVTSLGGSNFYRVLLNSLRASVPFDNVIVILFRSDATPRVLYRDFKGENVFKNFENLYLQRYYVEDPVFHHHLEKRGNGVFRLLDIAPKYFYKTDYFKDYYGNIGISDEMTFVQSFDEDKTLTISIGKDGRSSTKFSPEELEFLQSHCALLLKLIQTHLVVSSAPPLEHGDGASPDSFLIAMRERCGIALSPRQAQVALLILRGHSSESISLNLSISPLTVKVFRKQLYRKCAISSQAELFALAQPVYEQLRAR